MSAPPTYHRMDNGHLCGPSVAALSLVMVEVVAALAGGVHRHPYPHPYHHPIQQLQQPTRTRSPLLPPALALASPSRLLEAAGHQLTLEAAAPRLC